MRLAFATVVSRRQLAEARALAASLRRHQPDARLHVVVLDDPRGFFRPEQEDFALLRLADLALPRERETCFRHDEPDLARVARAWLLARLLARGEPAVVCVDGGSVLTRPLDDLARCLETTSMLAGPRLVAATAAPAAVAWLSRWRSAALDGPSPLRAEQDALREAGGDPGADRGLAAASAEELLASGDRECRSWPYGHGTFADGRAIGPALRELFAQQAPGRFSDPFDVSGDATFLSFAVTPPARDIGRRARAWLTGRSAPRVEDLAPLARHLLQATGFSGDLVSFLRRLAQVGPADHGLAPAWCRRWLAAAGVPCAVAQLVALYARDPELQRRFPRAFLEEHDAPLFLEHVASRAAELGLAAETAADLRALARDRPAALVADILAARPDLRAAFPGAPRAGGPAFSRWIRQSGMREYGLAEDDVLWFERGREQRAALGVTAAAATAPARAEPVRGRSGGEGATVVGFLRSESGTGELARATVRALQAVDYPVDTITLEEAPHRTSDLSVACVESRAPRPFTLVHVNARETPLLRRRFESRRQHSRMIGYWAWELASFPPEWEPAFALFDEVWTCSRFARDAIAAASPVPVHVAWPAVGGVLPAAADWTALAAADEFTFLFTCDFLSEIERKNPFGLLAAFRSGFRADDRVRLVVKTTNGALRPADLARLRQAAAGLRVTIEDAYWPRPELLGLIASCGAYVSLHRAEGFGFPLAEAMALGRPVIATGYSGNLDFMSSDNSRLVPSRLVEIAETHGPYRAGAHWAEPDLGAAAALMRGLYEQREEAARLGSLGQREVAELLSREACGRRLRARLTG